MAGRVAQVEGQQVGVLEHRHRMLDAGRHPDRPRRRHQVVAVLDGEAHHAGGGQRDLSPRMVVRHDPRVGGEPVQLDAHRPDRVRLVQMRRERTDGGRGRSARHWQDLDRS